MNPQPLSLPLLTAALLAALSVPSLHAATAFTWDGSGNPNTSGNWTDATNWNPDGTPALSNSDTVTLGNVTPGTRTISINSGETATAKSIAFTQSTAGGFNILSIASGGTLNLGGGQTWAAPTAGTSRVDLGGTVDFTGLNSGSVAINTDLTFTGAGSILRSSGSGDAVFTFGGAVNVNAGSGTAQITYAHATNLKKTSATFGSSLSVNSGTLEIAGNTYSSSPGAAITVQGTTTIAAGAGIKLTSDSGNNVAGGSSGVTFTNSGTLTQGGTIVVNPRGNGGASTITNSATWRVSGLSAGIEKSSRTNTVVPAFSNSSTGVFTGSTASDKITYTNPNPDPLTGGGPTIAFTNSGVIAAGNGSNGSGLTSVGTLTLVNFAITNSVTTSSLTFDIGGATSGQFDVLAFQSSTLKLDNAMLAIKLVNGFAPSSSFSVDILTSDVPSSVSGSFVGLTVNGSANSDYSFAYNSTTGIGTLSYTASSIPEPSTYAIAAGVISLGMVSFRRRRGKNVSV